LVPALDKHKPRRYYRCTMTDIYISVDIEASGPIPGQYSMLSLGASVVDGADQSFYVELKPINWNYDPEALKISGLDMETLMQTGAEPAEAMGLFEAWIARVTPAGSTPVFVGYPVAFDWMFVAYYFHRYLGHNPLGYAGIDLKSFYMGMTGRGWTETRRPEMSDVARLGDKLTHNAREDAVLQGELFRHLLAQRTSEGGIHSG
jgi:DNA polymerase III epsilon subunit-like protein